MIVSLREACADPALLGVDLWPAQREMVDALDEGVSLLVAALGRRSGKTTTAAAALVHDALLRPELDDMVMKGETRYAVSIATGLRQARILVAQARAMVEASPVLAGYLVGASDDELRFERPGNGTPRRSAIAAFPCSSRAARGWAISTLVLDELAHFLTETEGPATAERVWAATTPAVAQFGALGRVIVCSTPLGSDGLFARLHEDAAAGELGSAVALQVATADANPTIDPVWLEAQRRLLSPGEWGQEYGALFVAGGAGFMDLEQVARWAHQPAEPAAIAEAVCGLDPGARDGFGLVVLGRSIDPYLGTPVSPPRLRVAHVEALDASGDFTGAVDRAGEVARRFGAQVVTDQYAGPMVADRLRESGLVVRVAPWATSSGKTAVGKWEAYVDMRGRLYDGTLELLDDAEMRTELRALTVRVSNGSRQVVSPRRKGSHGDRASALALAVAHAPEVDVHVPTAREVAERQALERRVKRLDAMGFEEWMTKRHRGQAPPDPDGWLGVKW